MWRRVYDTDGKEVGDQGRFFETIRSEHQTTIKVEMLDTAFHEVDGGTIFSADRDNDLTNFITDGSIDVDTTRGTRRTAELTLMNPTAEFTPSTGDFVAEGPWVGKVYLNRIVRIWRGVYWSGVPLYVPVGTFMIDACDVILERNMSLVNLTMSDLWKKLNKSYLSYDKVYAENTDYNDIITDLITDAGVKMTGKYGANIGSLSERATDDRRTAHKTKVAQGTSRGDKLKELCTKWDVDAYFDPMGVFRTEDRRRDRDKEQVWHFYSAPITEDGKSGNLLTLKRSFNDDNLYNHVVVIGTGNDKRTVRVSKRDTNPSSKSAVGLIGDRVYLYESNNISNDTQGNRALARLWKMRFQLGESIEAQVISNPALEGDDVVRFTERDFVKVDDRYRLARFNVPLVSTLQTVQAMNILRSDDL